VRTALASACPGEVNMDAKFPKYVPLVLLPAILGVFGCGDRNVLAPTDAASQQVFVTAEPVKARPEFLPSPPCPVLPAFGARVRLGLRSSRSITVRDIQFDFEDRFGRRTAPVVTLTALGSSTTLGSTSPVTIPTSSTLPTASPIPIPGFSPLRDIALTAGGTQDFAFFLEFACGIVAEGTIFVGVDTLDRFGARTTSRVTIGLGN
jgi:hypothetical protein